MRYTKESGTELFKKADHSPIRLFTKGLAFYFLMLPAGALAIGAAGSLLRVIGFALVVVGILQYREENKGRQVLYLFLFVCWLALSLLWSLDAAISFQRVFSNACFLLLLFVAAAYEYREEELACLKRCLVWSSRLTVPLTVLFAGWYEGRLRMSGAVSEDPNYLCMYFSFGVVSCVERLCGDSRIFAKLAAFAELLIYLCLIFATGSRGGVLAVAVMIVCTLFLRTGKKTHTFRRLLWKLLTLLAIFAACVLAANFVLRDLTARYSIAEIITLRGAGRFEIWRDALRTFRDADLFRKLCGFGTGTAKLVSQLYAFSRNTVMHNMFIENLIETGLIGLILYSVYIFSFWNSAKKSGDVFAAAVMTGMIVMSLSVSIYAFKPYWNIMIYILCVQNRAARREERKERRRRRASTREGEARI